MAIHKRVSKSGKVSYRVKVHQGYDGNKRSEVTKTCATKKEALAEEARIKSQIDQGTFVEPNRLTVGQYLDEWLEKSAQVKLKRQTWQLYRNIVDIYIKPTLGKVLLTKLTPLTIEGLYAQLGQGPKAKAPQTIKNVHTEYLALHWNDLNWNGATARIERTLVRPKGGGYILDTPKTKKSCRTVHLTPELLVLLGEHKRKQDIAREVLADKWQGKEDFIGGVQGANPPDRFYFDKNSRRRSGGKLKRPGTQLSPAAPNSVRAFASCPQPSRAHNQAL